MLVLPALRFLLLSIVSNVAVTGAESDVLVVVVFATAAATPAAAADDVVTFFLAAFAFAAANRASINALTLSLLLANNTAASFASIAFFSNLICRSGSFSFNFSFAFVYNIK